MSDQQECAAARRIAETASKGLIVVDATGQILWTDARLRQRLDGELNRLTLPLDRGGTRASRPQIDGFVTTIDVEIAGEHAEVCVIQQVATKQSAERKPEAASTSDPIPDTDLQRIVDAVQEVLAEPSWLTRTFTEKLKARLQAGGPSSAVADLKRLTAREREILGLVCEGCSDAAMADILNLSQNTVRNHLASLFRKIGVNRRSAAVIWARERAITKHDTLESSVVRDRASRTDGDSP